MKKLSGIYVDEQGFRHTVFYHRSNRCYFKLVYNPEGKFCSSAEYTREQAKNQVSGMTRSFYYMGNVFTPIGNTGKSFIGASKCLRGEFISYREGYKYEDFYTSVRKAEVKVVDLYKVFGTKKNLTVIPASGALFVYDEL